MCSMGLIKIKDLRGKKNLTYQWVILPVKWNKLQSYLGSHFSKLLMPWDSSLGECIKIQAITILFKDKLCLSCKNKRFFFFYGMCRKLPPNTGSAPSVNHHPFTCCSRLTDIMWNFPLQVLLPWVPAIWTLVHNPGTKCGFMLTELLEEQSLREALKWEVDRFSYNKG